MNFKRTAALVATTSLAFSLIGCGTQTAPSAAGMTTAQATVNAAARRAKREKAGTWNILIHMSAENNLYRFGLEDLNEMEAGAGVEGINVFVLFDGIKDGDSAIYHIQKDPGGLNGNIISTKVNAPTVIPASNEIDSGDVGVAVKFVEWAAKNAPADNTFVGYWDHGSGLFNGNPNPITKGFGWDDKGSNMETADLTTIGNAFKAASGKPLAIVGFDACLMAHGELAYQLGTSADILLASEELEPGKGWDYAGFLKAAAASNRTPSAVASALVKSYGASYAPGGSQTSGRDEITLSALDIQAFNGTVVPALNNFATAASAEMAANKAAFQAARAKAQVFYNKDCADLGSFLNAAKTTVKGGALGGAIGSLQTAYAASVIAETHSSHFPGATGAVLYFPTPTQRINPIYLDATKTGFAKTEWKGFLQNYR